MMLPFVAPVRQEIGIFLKQLKSCENPDCKQKDAPTAKHLHEAFFTRKDLMGIKALDVHICTFLCLPNLFVLCDECHLNKLTSREFFYNLALKRDFRKYAKPMLDQCNMFTAIVNNTPYLDPYTVTIDDFFKKFDEFHRVGLIKIRIKRP